VAVTKVCPPPKILKANMATKEMLMDTMRVQIDLSRKALFTDITVAQVHFDNVTTLSEAIKILNAYEAMLINELEDVD
jgi:hypothetical protein